MTVTVTGGMMWAIPVPWTKKTTHSTQTGVPAPKKAKQSNPQGQATGGWSPFAPAAGTQDVADAVEYDAFDRVKGKWDTFKPKAGN